MITTFKEIIPYFIYFVIVLIIFKIVKWDKNPFKNIWFWASFIIGSVILTVLTVILFVAAVVGDEPKSKEGLNKEYFEDGKIHREYTIRNGKCDGYYKSWYKSGQIESICKYKNGNPVDSCFDYFESGKILTVEIYRDGEKEQLIRFHENGQLREKEEYDNTKPTDKYFEKLSGDKLVSYYPDGSISSTVKIMDGKLEGPATFYYKNGKAKLVGQYKSGQKDGVWQKLDSITSNIVDSDSFDYTNSRGFKDNWE
jgi:antitoxin component YwqK of YwqJK toxin-antitoxin module